MRSINLQTYNFVCTVWLTYCNQQWHLVREIPPKPLTPIPQPFFFIYAIDTTKWFSFPNNSIIPPQMRNYMKNLKYIIYMLILEYMMKDSQWICTPSGRCLTESIRFVCPPRNYKVERANSAACWMMTWEGNSMWQIQKANEMFADDPRVHLPTLEQSSLISLPRDFPFSSCID